MTTPRCISDQRGLHSVTTARVFTLDQGFFCYIWGSGGFIENLGFFAVA